MTTPDWEAEVLRQTGGLGVDHVIEVGGGTMVRSMQSCAIGGQIHMIGAVSGMERINPADLILGCRTVRGFMVGSRADFEAMNKALATHRIKPAIDRVFDFEVAADAYRHLESGAHVGKVVIRI